jgi:hypothetical protein
MFNSPPPNLQAALLAAFLLPPALAQTPVPGPDGIVKVRSADGVDETMTRPQRDIADKGSVVEVITSTIRAH